jgi:hypothetical protein
MHGTSASYAYDHPHDPTRSRRRLSTQPLRTLPPRFLFATRCYTRIASSGTSSTTCLHELHVVTCGAGGGALYGCAGRTVQDEAKKSMLDILTRVHGDDGSRLGDDPAELDDVADGEQHGTDDDEVCACSRVSGMGIVAASRIRADRRVFGDRLPKTDMTILWA